MPALTGPVTRSQAAEVRAAAAAPLEDASLYAPPITRSFRAKTAVSTLPSIPEEPRKRKRKRSRSPAPSPAPPPTPQTSKPPKYLGPVPDTLSGPARVKWTQRTKRYVKRLAKDKEDGRDFGRRVVKEKAARHRDAAEVVETDYEPLPQLWQGAMSKYDSRTWSEDDFAVLVDKERFRHIKWPGLTPKVILDRDGHLLVVLAGHSNQPDWVPMTVEAARLAREAGLRCVFDYDHSVHRHGVYHTLGYGISYGGGRTEPGPIDNKDVNDEELRTLFASDAFDRMPSFADSSLANYFPDIFTDYEYTTQAVEQDNPKLQGPFPKCAFAAAHVNFDRATTYAHTDHANRLRGLCALYPLDEFDHTRGGQLILWDLKLIIDVLPGNLVLIPSAMLLHGNASIGEDERRSAFVMFSAAGLFRWVHNGMKSDKDFLAGATRAKLEKWKAFRNELPSYNISGFPIWRRTTTRT